MYNAITREMEAELLPCCRKFGIRVVIYNPLAYVSRRESETLLISYCHHSGGLFSGKITSHDETLAAGGRFDVSGKMGQMYRARYLNNGYFEAIEHLRSVAVRMKKFG